MNGLPTLVVNESGELVYDREEPTDNLVTWVYSHGYTPIAKIVDGQRYSIISDYIGRPVQAFDDRGAKVWSTDYDIYGRLRNLEGDRQFIPFRQLGQYEDIELNGLYYNRFRYYDSNSGLYISKDPIGLAGNNPIMYTYVWDSNGMVDVFGLANQYQIHSPSQPDIVSKGLHFYGKDNIELSIKPNVDGDISFKSVFSTKNLSTKEVDKINNAIKDAQSKFDTDSKWRQHILDNAIIAKETVIEAHGQGKMGDKAKGRSAEFHFIEKNIKKKYK